MQNRGLDRHPYHRNKPPRLPEWAEILLRYGLRIIYRAAASRRLGTDRQRRRLSRGQLHLGRERFQSLWQEHGPRRHGMKPRIFQRTRNRLGTKCPPARFRCNRPATTRWCVQQPASPTAKRQPDRQAATALIVLLRTRFASERQALGTRTQSHVPENRRGGSRNIRNNRLNLPSLTATATVWAVRWFPAKLRPLPAHRPRPGA